RPACAVLAPVGGLLSVALSVGSRPLGVTQHLALWSSDFPRRGTSATAFAEASEPPPRSPGRLGIRIERAIQRLVDELVRARVLLPSDGHETDRGELRGRASRLGVQRLEPCVLDPVLA